MEIFLLLYNYSRAAHYFFQTMTLTSKVNFTARQGAEKGGNLNALGEGVNTFIFPVISLDRLQICKILLISQRKICVKSSVIIFDLPQGILWLNFLPISKEWKDERKEKKMFRSLRLCSNLISHHIREWMEGRKKGKSCLVIRCNLRNRLRVIWEQI